MKRCPGLFGLVLALFFSASVAFAADMNSKISSVVVYSGSALITRSGTVDLPAGSHQVVFSDIIPEIDENSLKVSGQGSAGTKILGAGVRREFLQEASGERARELEARILSVRDELRTVRDAKNVAAHKRQLLDSLLSFSRGQMPEDMVTKMPQAKELNELLGFLDISFKDYYGALAALDVKERELNRKLEVLQREWNQVAGSPRMKRSIVVEVETASSGPVVLQASYLVSAATWTPVYEARASFEKSQVELIGFGVVRQTTGEDWKDVEMTLSTAKPSVSGRMPELSSWILKPYEQPVTSTRRMKFAGQGRGLDAEPPMALEMKSELSEDKLQEAVVDTAAVQEKGISVIYKISRKVTIKSDGSQERLGVLSQNLPAKFKYSAFPKASVFAYLKASVTNDKNLQLLPGRMNVFLEGDFVGVSSLSAIAPGEEFDLSLGIDENVKIKKEEISRKIDDILLGSIPSPDRKVTIVFKVTAENYKGKEILFELFDAMPVSQDERIRSRVERLSPDPKDKDYKDKKGVWRWEFSLAPSAKKEISYTVVIEYPRNLRVEGL
ncbi:MAG: mucoidy inhibitor MuiA family protein [Candidatus Omnitrophota bacterium]